MTFSRGLLTGCFAASMMVGGATAAVLSAPPASAGCLAADPDNTYCDDPVEPNGTWHRCHQKAGQVVYQNGWVFKRMPPTNFCYTVDPAQPWNSTRPGEPQTHID
jgi:hypothetical protein